VIIHKKSTYENQHKKHQKMSQIKQHATKDNENSDGSQVEN